MYHAGKFRPVTVKRAVCQTSEKRVCSIEHQKAVGVESWNGGFDQTLRLLY